MAGLLNGDLKIYRNFGRDYLRESRWDGMWMKNIYSSETDKEARLERSRL
jgi:hypothetical protein